MTLVEVVVAIAVAGLVLSAISEALVVSARARHELTAATRAAERAANGHRVLTELFAAARTDSAGGEFRGDVRSNGHAVLGFTTLVQDIVGIRRRVRVTISHGNEKLFAELEREGIVPDTAVLLTGVRSVDVEYLPEAGAAWTRRYVTAAQLPLAVRINVRQQTTLARTYLVGPVLR